MTLERLRTSANFIVPIEFVAVSLNLLKRRSKVKGKSLNLGRRLADISGEMRETSEMRRLRFSSDADIVRLTNEIFEQCFYLPNPCFTVLYFPGYEICFC